jgi:hypothetical protein
MAGFPNPRIQVPELDPILEAWRLTSEQHEWPRSATDAEIAEAEQVVGRSFPPALRAIYQIGDGPSLFHGNLNFNPIRPGEDTLALPLASKQLREWSWPIPDELIVFADDGCDEHFGIWIPVGSSEQSPHPVIWVGSIFDEPKCLAVIGTGICEFLRIWTAFQQLNDKQTWEESPMPHAALDALSVPPQWREEVLKDADLRDLSWADPGLPDFNPDPYERGVDAQQLRRMYGGNESTKKR